MTYRLINEADPRKTLILKARAWYRLLETAEDSGWNPLGPVQPELWLSYSTGLSGESYPFITEPLGDYSPWTRSKVILEDALNLADALHRYFLEYEPTQFDYHGSRFLTEFDNNHNGHAPAIGVVLLVRDFCRDGSFLIERC